MSRNRYIIRAIERTLETETRWSSDFVKEIAAARSDAEGRQVLDEAMVTIAAERTRKAPPEL